MINWLPILVMLFIGIGFAIASLGVSYLLSPKNPTPEKLTPYESGIFPEEEPSQRFPVKFYMVAMLYIVFDIEIIFLLAWATRFEQLGWYGIVVIFIFTFFDLYPSILDSMGIALIFTFVSVTRSALWRRFFRRRR